MKPQQVLPEPTTLGEHIKRRRLELGLTQKEAARELRVDAFTVLNWEKNKTDPSIPFVPAILKLLGYDPFPTPHTLGERMLAKRRAMGWTIREAATRIGVDESTWGEWEKFGNIPWQRYRAMVELVLDTYTCNGRE